MSAGRLDSLVSVSGGLKHTWAASGHTLCTHLKKSVRECMKVLETVSKQKKTKRRRVLTGGSQSWRLVEERRGKKRKRKEARWEAKRGSLFFHRSTTVHYLRRRRFTVCGGSDLKNKNIKLIYHLSKYKFNPPKKHVTKHQNAKH